MGISELLPIDFRQVSSSVSFELSPEQAIAFFQAKGLKPTFAWDDMIGEEHSRAFTVAKMMDMDLLADTKDLVEEAIATGKSFEWFKQELIPMLRAKGWWGKQKTLDPSIGFSPVSQLGSVPRLATIYRTNMQSAYAVGSWQTIQNQKDVAPYLLYDAIDDHRTRPEHARWDGKVFPVDSNFWKTHYPPNGWNCRCGVIQLTQKQLERMNKTGPDPEPKIPTYKWFNKRTGNTYSVPKGLDPGWDHNPGMSSRQKLQELFAEKIAILPSDMREAALRSLGQAARRKELESMATESIAKTKAAQKALAKSVGKEQLEQSLSRAQAKAAALRETKAAAAIEKIVAGKADDPGKHKLKAHKILSDIGDWSAKPATKQLEQINILAKNLKEKQLNKSYLSGYKKKVLLGKKPTPAQENALKSLNKEEADKFFQTIADEKQQLEDWKVASLDLKLSVDEESISAFLKLGKNQKKQAIDGLKAELNQKLADALEDLQQSAADAVHKPKSLEFSKMVQRAGQGGSNPGGIYEDLETGIRYYIKTPPSEEIARNELLTAKLYELVGVEVPEYSLIKVNGKTGIASRIIDDLIRSPEQLKNRLPGVGEGFAADAWLANWDVIGLGYDNMLVKAGRAIRLDTGGGLRFRAQGSPKGAAFGDLVDEIDSLRDPRINPQSASVFSQLTENEILASARRVVNVSDDDIARVVKDFGPTDAADRRLLIDRLIARREDLRKRFPALVEAQPAAQPPGGFISDVEARSVLESRLNGFTIPSDKDLIEDQSILFHVYKNEDGVDFTRAWLKLRRQPGVEFQKGLEVSKSGAQVIASVNTEEVKRRIRETVVGINHQADNFAPYRSKDIARLKETKAALDKTLQEFEEFFRKGGDDLKATGSYAKLKDWRIDIEKMIAGAKEGKKAKRFERYFSGADIKDRFEIVDDLKLKPGTWADLDEFEYELNRIENGYGQNTLELANAPRISSSYLRDLDRGRVKYVPYDKGNNFSMEGIMQVDVRGAGREAIEEALRILDDIGVDTTRPPQKLQEILWLDKVMYLRTAKRPAAWKKYLEKTAGDLEKKIKAVNKEIGFDVTESSAFRQARGQHFAFGHGRQKPIRPDLDTDDFRDFEKTFTLYHNPTGLSSSGIEGHGTWERLKRVIDSGGQFSSQTDRVRRGVKVGGSSATDDLTTGGGNYFYTRIQRRSKLSSASHTGIFIRPRQIKRLDAVTYTTDEFGSVRDGTLRGHTRKIDIEGFHQASKRSNNETIFKDGLSIFDDTEKIILWDRAEYLQALEDMRAIGYTSWPDGRSLEDVFDYVRK